MIWLEAAQWLVIVALVWRAWRHEQVVVSAFAGLHNLMLVHARMIDAIATVVRVDLSQRSAGADEDVGRDSIEPPRMN